MEILRLRDRLWLWTMRNHNEVAIMHVWQRVVFAVLHPKTALQYWLYDGPYDPCRDVWTIHGVRFSGRFLRDICGPEWVTYRMRREGDHVIIQRVEDRGTITAQRDG